MVEQGVPGDSLLSALQQFAFGQGAQPADAEAVGGVGAVLILQIWKGTRWEERDSEEK